MPETPCQFQSMTSPSVARNREPILAVLRDVLPRSGTVLEIASGTGEHAAFFTAALPSIQWQPTDRDPDALDIIAAHRAASRQPNLLAPVLLDASATDWPVTRADAIVAINMVHISPWHATEGLMAGAARILPSGGILYFYGAYRDGEVQTAQSNEAFDADLKRRNPEWGLRDVRTVVQLAESRGLALIKRVEMPAHNLSLVFRKR